MMLKVCTLAVDLQSKSIMNCKSAHKLCEKDYDVDISELSSSHVKEFVNFLIDLFVNFFPN